jgi:hypothetical protein
MKKAVFFLLISFNLLFAFVYLGKYGPTVDISEPDAMDMMKKAFKDFNKTKAMENFKKSFHKYMEVNLSVPICKANRQEIFDPTIILTHDIDMPKFGIHLKAGEKFNPLQYGFFNKYLFFIDGTDKKQLLLAKKYKDKAFIIITKGNIEKVSNYLGKQVFKADKLLIKQLQLKCVPTVYMQDGTKFKKFEFLLKVEDEKTNN